ncbi:MAG: ankyrin repeat domain-containing protein [Pyrinomonadaceae bacterium]
MPKQTDHLKLFPIATPCPADWDSMTGNDRVRFCDHCALHVHDLSEMTPTAAIKLAANSNGRLCVRYYKQPDSAAQPTAPALHQIGRRASRIAAGVFSATLGLSATSAAALARPQANLLVFTGAASASSREAGGKRSVNGANPAIAGRVLDQNGAAVPGARVTLTDTNTNTEQVTTSGDDGQFSFEHLNAGDYVLVVDSPGFKSAKVEGLNIEAGSERSVVVTLEVGEIVGGAMVVVSPSEPVVKAAMDDDLDALRKLLDAGANVNTVDENYGLTALAMAAGNGNLEMVQLLLWYGADVNAKGPRGNTALMNLSGRSTAEVARALINAGANVALQDEDGDTALILLASDNNTEVLQALIDAGASVNTKNKQGQTALMLAASQGVVDNVKALLAAGANIYERDEEGTTVLKYVRDNGHHNLVKLLREYGAVDYDAR